MTNTTNTTTVINHDHDRYDHHPPSSASALPSSPRFRTIMSYVENCKGPYLHVSNLFSNPNVDLEDADGVATGTPTEDNARELVANMVR